MAADQAATRAVLARLPDPRSPEAADVVNQTLLQTICTLTFDPETGECGFDFIRSPLVLDGTGLFGGRITDSVASAVVFLEPPVKVALELLDGAIEVLAERGMPGGGREKRARNRHDGHGR